MQVQNLCSLRLNVEEDLVNELGKLPEDLADTYTQIFEHVGRLAPQSCVIAERSLKWLLCQAKEFSEAEFLAAVSIGTEGESCSLTKETILFICGNSVMFDHALKVFRFAHLSVREYLEAQPKFTLGAAHALGAEISLLICLQRATELAAKYACTLRPYAFWFWRYHCQEAKKSGLSGRLYRLLKDFLQIREGTNVCYAEWVRSMHRLRQARDNESHNWILEARDGKRNSWSMKASDGKSDNWSVEASDRESDNSTEESDDESSYGTDDNLINGTPKEWRPDIDAWISGTILAETDQENTILKSILGDQGHPYDPTFAACFLELSEIVEQNLRSVLSSPAKKVGDLAVDNIKVFERRNMYGETYLHVACHRGIGSSKLLRLLLQYPVPIRAIDFMRRTALHYAVNPRDLVSSQSATWTKIVRDAHDPTNAAERVAMIGLLIEQASIIDAVDINGETALHRASNANFCTEAQCLLEHGAFVDVRTHKGLTPLHLAAKAGHTAVAQLLLQFKADIEARDSDRRTVLFQAVMKKKLDTVRFLLRLGADINAKDKYGKMPLAQSLVMRNEAMAQILIDESASIKMLDKSGSGTTMLHYAAGSRLGATVSRLLEMGAHNNETNFMVPLRSIWR